jgi:hypothetical protein
MPAEENQARQPQVPQFISVPAFARLAAINRWSAHWAVARAADGKHWRGTQLVVRQVRGSGGRSGKRYEVLLFSLPAALRAKWHRQQPNHELNEKVAEHAAAIEEEGGTRRRKGRRAVPGPWTQEEREAKHAAASRRPTSVQEAGKRKAAAVRFFRSLSKLGTSVSEREKIAAKETGVPVPTIRTWARICRGLDPGDWAVALAPKHRNCQPAAPFSFEACDYIWSEFFRLTKPALKPVYRRAIRLGKERGWRMPSYATVKRRIEAEPHYYHLLMREGQEAFEALYPTQQRDRDHVDRGAQPGCSLIRDRAHRK